MSEVIEIRNRWTDEVQFSWEADPEVTGLEYVEKLGRAVLAAIKARAYLSGAYLIGCDLRGCDLRRAYLIGCDLRGCDLRRADLRDADLRGCDLRGCDLRGCDLRRADLSDADLRGCDLRGCDLRGCDLRRADLRDAVGAELSIAQTRILPEGDLIGWKKCKAGVIVKLRIPADARRSHAFGRKCRAEYADVLEVIGSEVGVSSHDGKTEYRVGQRIVPDRFEDDWQQECAPGVHFFITRLEAENY